MPALPWRAYYNLGIDEIDEQHHTLVNLINEIFQQVDNGKISLVQDELMPEFTRYLKFHNLFEEKMMKDCNYPNIAQHSKGHQNMTARCESMLARLVDIDTTDLVEAVEEEFLRSVIQHLTGDDFELASFIKRLQTHNQDDTEAIES